jgi:tetratricopeptide (TPR) repeat protein
MALAREGRTAEALERLKEGILLANNHEGPEVRRLLRNAALLSLQLGRLKEAETFYKQASDQDPNDAYTHWALGDIYEKVGDPRLSKQHWDRFVELASGSQDEELADLLAKHRSTRSQKK